MNAAGRLLYTEAFATSQATLIGHVAAAPAYEKRLVFEESVLAGWIVEAFAPMWMNSSFVTRGRMRSSAAAATRTITRMPMNSVGCGRIDPCGPFQSGIPCRLQDCDAAAFRRNQAGLKTQTNQGLLVGVVHITGTRVFNKTDRAYYLRQLPGAARQATVRQLYTLLDAAISVQKEACAAMIRPGRRYPELQRFKQMPSIGELGAHMCDAFVQTPRRLPPSKSFCVTGNSAYWSAAVVENPWPTNASITRIQVH